MDVQEPEDQLEREAEAESAEQEAPAPESASRASDEDPSTGNEENLEPEGRSESSISPVEPSVDVAEAEEDDSTAAESVSGAAPETAPDGGAVEEATVAQDAAEPDLERELDELESPEATASEEAAPVEEAVPAPEAGTKPPARAESGGESPGVDGAVEGPAWYVVHCYSGYENKVRHNLEQRIETMGMKDKIFDVVIPTQEEIEVKDGKRRTVERHIFPGYVLVNMALSEESWYVVRNTPGVTGFVGMGNQPTPLRPEEVSQIIKRMEAEAPTVKVTFKVGERVRIVDGPFNDFRGVVAEIDMERTKVRVMVSFFGRETPVELDFLQVEKA